MKNPRLCESVLARAVYIAPSLFLCLQNQKHGEEVHGLPNLRHGGILLEAMDQDHLLSSPPPLHTHIQMHSQISMYIQEAA
jgi:hypothetical protein